MTVFSTSSAPALVHTVMKASERKVVRAELASSAVILSEAGSESSSWVDNSQTVIVNIDEEHAEMPKVATEKKKSPDDTPAFEPDFDLRSSSHALCPSLLSALAALLVYIYHQLFF